MIDKEKKKVRMALWRVENKEKIAKKSHERYVRKKEDIDAYNRKYQQEHKEKLYEAHKVWRIKNKERVLFKARIAQKKWALAHPDRIKANRYATRDKLRTDVLNAYGHKCQCCGITTKEFLAIDHINGGGAEHRRSLAKKASAQTMYTWLRKNNYPEGFQILCHNCNAAKSYYGGCPHVK